MKIISLNVNNFGGLEGKPLIKDYPKPQSSQTDWESWKKAVDTWRDSNKVEIMNNVDCIFCYINSGEIIILQEVDTNCDSFKKLKDEADKNNFLIVYPNGSLEEKFSDGYNSITCMLVKKYIMYKNNYENFSNKKYKNVEITVGELRIIGVHIPMGDVDYWDKLMVNYSCHEEEKVLIIGDMNVSDFGTCQKKKYLEFLRKGIIDLWIDLGGDIEKSTCNTMKRLDYALVSNAVMTDVYNIEILDSVRNNGYTDHSLILVVL